MDGHKYFLPFRQKIGSRVCMRSDWDMHKISLDTFPISRKMVCTDQEKATDMVIKIRYILANFKKESILK